VVSIAAAAFACLQARVARGARDATIDQAKTARKALELQRAQQHQVDAPTFALAIVPSDGEPHRAPAEGDQARVSGIRCQQVRQASAQVHHGDRAPLAVFLTFLQPVL
jgi:hypothetical protein